MSIKLKQRVMQLETINYDCYRHIGELLAVKNDLHEEILAQEGTKKGFY